MSETLKTDQKSRRRWRIAGITGAIAAGILGTWHFFLRGNSQEEKLLEFPTETTTTDTSANRPPANSGSASSKTYQYRGNYPIEQFTYGPKVEQLQIALNTGGAGLKLDGYWGPSTQRAVERAGLPSKISSDAYLQQLRGKTGQTTATTTPMGDAAARTIARATNGGDSDTVLAVLRQMRDTSDYRKVSTPLANVFNDELETYDRFGNKANRNLVNTLLADRMGWSLQEKNAFAVELRRMGLVQRNGSWSLSGIVDGTQRYIALRDTTAIDEAGYPVSIKAGTYVGEVVRSDPVDTVVSPYEGLYLSVPTAHIGLY